MPTLAERLETATTTLEGLVANTTGTGDMVLKTGAVIAPTSVNGNTITTGTGTLTLGTFTLVIGGNITFGAMGRTLAATADAAAARTAIGAGTSSFDPVSPGPIGFTTPAAFKGTSGWFTSMLLGNSAGVRQEAGSVGIYGFNSSDAGTWSIINETGAATFNTLSVGSGALVMGGNVTFSGAYATTFTATGATTLTLPMTGTLATLAGAETFTNKSATALRLTAPVVPSSDTTGYTIFNTSDEATNYERGRIYFTSNTLYFGSEKGGTGTARDIRIIAGTSQYFEVKTAGSTTGAFRFVGLTTAVVNAIGYNFSSWGSSASSGTSVGFALTPTYNQSSTAGATDWLINRTESAIGSGTQRFASFQVASVEKFGFSNKGVFLPSGAVVLPAYTVATLPATAALGMVAGAVCCVTDALAPAWNVALVGGGAIHCGARYNGAAWVAC